MMKTFLAILALMTSVNAFAYSTAVRTDYTAQSIFSTGWTQIVASLPQFSTYVAVADNSNQAILLGVGAAGSEVAQMIIPSASTSAITVYPLQIPAGARVSLKSTVGVIRGGEDDMSFFH